MNYYNLNKIIQLAALSNSLVLEYHNNDIYEEMNTTQHKYPAVVLTVLSINNDGITDIQTINGVLFYVDRLTDDLSNKIQVLSTGMTVLKLIFAKLQEDYNGLTIESENYTLYQEKFADICAGMYCTFSISYENDVICSDSEFVVKTLDIYNNGTYNVGGYDFVDVDVDTSLPELEKSLNVSTNGSYVVLPDSGKVLNKVNVSVNIDIPQILSTGSSLISRAVESRWYSIYPNPGYAGLAEAKFKFEVSKSTLEKTIVQNGQYTYNPSTNTFYKDASIYVNVPTTITVSLTLAEYDALAVKDQNTIYLITN